MKRIPKILKIIFISIFVLQIIGLAVWLFLPVVTQAADPIKFNPQVSIPDSQFTHDPAKDGGKELFGNEIGKYIQAIYKYAIGIVGILATAVMMFGGFLYLTAAGDNSKMSEAKEWIKSSLTGLIIALSSYMILATVNPDLVNLKMAEVKQVGVIGCCTGTNPHSIIEKSKCTTGTWTAGASLGNDGKCNSVSSKTTCYWAAPSGQTCTAMSEGECNNKAGSYLSQSECNARLSNSNGGCCVYNYNSNDSIYLNCVAESSVDQTYCMSRPGSPSFASGKNCVQYSRSGTLHYKCEQ